MALRVTTTGSDVYLDDLGIVVVHPTTNRDLSLEFSALDLKHSNDLTDAIQSGSLLANDGNFSLIADDYDPDEVLIQQLGFRGDEKYISHDELRSNGEIPITSGFFPLSLNSTATVTRNVYVPGGKWILWEAAIGDKVEILGTQASGIYTVESIVDQQNLIVEESIVNSTGGTITLYHPPGATRIGIDSSLFDNIVGNNLQDILQSIDSELVQTSGISVGSHRDLDQLVHNIAEDSYEEYTYSGILATNMIIWTNITKTTKIREEQYTYGTGNRISQLTMIQYNSQGNVEETITETYTYSGIKVISIDRNLI
jgi:hypothetical protein